MTVDWRWDRFWYRPVSGLGRRYGWMVLGRRIASLTIHQGSRRWMLRIGPVMISS